jgi:hypothetical protein
MVNFSDFSMNQKKSYSRMNIENVPDGTQILKILRHMSYCNIVLSKSSKRAILKQKISKLAHSGRNKIYPKLPFSLFLLILSQKM